jgi:hypothetical protein
LPPAPRKRQNDYANNWKKQTHKKTASNGRFGRSKSVNSRQMDKDEEEDSHSSGEETDSQEEDEWENVPYHIRQEMEKKDQLVRDMVKQVKDVQATLDLAIQERIASTGLQGSANTPQAPPGGNLASPGLPSIMPPPIATPLGGAAAGIGQGAGVTLPESGATPGNTTNTANHAAGAGGGATNTTGTEPGTQTGNTTAAENNRNGANAFLNSMADLIREAKGNVMSAPAASSSSSSSSSGPQSTADPLKVRCRTREQALKDWGRAIRLAAQSVEASSISKRPPQ